MLDLKNAKSVLDHFIRLSSICFLLSSCSGPRQDDNLMENKNLYSIDLDHSTKERSFVFSSIFCDLETIILDSEEKVIGNIDKIQADDSTIYILDINISKGVFKYSRNGNYIQQIGNIGSGPGEYIKPFDFTLDQKNRIIYILDGPRQRINKYEMTSGKYLGHFEINKDDPIRSYHIQYNDGVIFTDVYTLAPSKRDFLLQKLDTCKGKQQSTFLNATQYNKGWKNPSYIHDHVFYTVNEESSRFMQVFMNTIIYISREKVMPYLSLQSEDIMTAEDIASIEKNAPIHSVFDYIFSKNKIFDINSYFEYDGRIYFVYRNGLTSTFTTYDTETNETKLYDTIADDLLFEKDNMHVWFPKFGCAGNEGVYYYVNTNAIGNFMEGFSLNLFSKNLNKSDKLKKMKDDANPVIFFYKYKTLPDE